MSRNLLFQPIKVGPLKLRNRSVRSAAFEGMCPGGRPSRSLIDYHKNVASSGIGMTTVAYVSVTNDGRTFAHQAWMDEDTAIEFRKLTDIVHREGAAVSVQLGHGGNMGNRKVGGKRAIAPSGRINLYGPTFPRAMTEQDIEEIIEAHGKAVLLARKAGFDAVEIHAGHGYLINQFLSPYTNTRRDRWGGSFENRTRFLREVMKEVRNTAGKNTAVIVKCNMEDGFSGGMSKDECLQVAGLLEVEGADALVLSAGFVSRSSFYMLKGQTPHQDLIKAERNLFKKAGMIFFSRLMLKEYPYHEIFFLEDALYFRKKLNLPLIYVGGLLNKDGIDRVLSNGFDAVALARALIAEPDFISRIYADPKHVSPCRRCGPCNGCVATMFNSEMQCTFKPTEKTSRT